MTIRFENSGWQAVIADEFTFANVRLLTRAICEQFVETGADTSSSPLVIGYDTRFLGEQFAEQSAKEAARCGFRALVCDRPTPMPAVSHAVRHHGAIGAINFTASHNSPEYSGMKFSTADGAPALPDAARRVEQLFRQLGEGSAPASAASVSASKASDFEYFDARTDYLSDLAGKVRLEAIAHSGARYAYDPRWGTGRGYLDDALRERGLAVETLHDWRDVMFGGESTEPGEERMGDLAESVRSGNCTLGLMTGGNGENFGVLDRDATFIAPNLLIALLFDYLAETRGATCGVARSVATSHLVDRVAEARGLPVYETPVGFKSIGELILQDKITLGGEASGGLTINGHCPVRDGIIACLLAAEAVAVRGASLCEQLAELHTRVGRLYNASLDVALKPNLAAALPKKLMREPEAIGGRRVERTNHLDGVKFFFGDGSWLLMRPAETEPLVRIYAESESKVDLEVLLEQGRKFLLD